MTATNLASAGGPKQVRLARVSTSVMKRRNYQKFRSTQENTIRPSSQLEKEQSVNQIFHNQSQDIKERTKMVKRLKMADFYSNRTESSNIVQTQ